MGSEHIYTRHRPPSKLRVLAVLIFVLLLLSSTFIFNSPLEIIESSSGSQTRGEGDDENTTTSSRDSNRTRENRRDSDNDGIDDDEEMEMGTNPENPDSDSDGIPDGEDYYPLEPSLWRSPIQILMQVVLEILVFLTLIFSYIAYRMVSKRKKKKEEE